MVQRELEVLTSVPWPKVLRIRHSSGAQVLGLCTACGFSVPGAGVHSGILAQKPVLQAVSSLVSMPFTTLPKGLKVCFKMQQLEKQTEVVRMA